MKKTKIICTLGPASNNRETLKALMENGMDIARFNFSHGDYEGECERTKRRDPLLFLFKRNGTRIYQDGILHRRWRSGNVQECEEVEGSSGKYSADINRT